MGSTVTIDQKVYGYDYSYLEVIDLQSYYEHSWSRKDFENHQLILARTVKHVVGYAAIKQVAEARRLMQVVRLAVYPPFRRQGIAGRLVKYLLDQAADMEIKRMTMVLRETNDVGIKFLAHQQFRAVHTMRAHFGEGNDGIFFKRDVVLAKPDTH